MVDLHCCDNVTGMQTLPDESVDLTVTSPPYDNLRNYGGHSWDFESLARELYRVTKRGGVVVWVTNDATIKGSETLSSFKQALFFTECGFNLHDTMIYRKTCYPRSGSLLAYQNAFEYMFVFSKGKPKVFNPIKDIPNKYKGVKQKGTKREKNGTLSQYDFIVKDVRQRDNVWNYDPGYMKGAKDKIAYQHPAIFPEALARDHILSWSNEGDTVLDPFAGSGTTLKMAAMLNRNAIGFEIHEPYVEIARQRLASVEIMGGF